MYRMFSKLKIFLSVFLFVIFLTPTLSYASSHLTGWTHFGIRPLGMGNAFVGIADDYNAIFYNPAGIGLQNKFGLQLISPSIAISGSSITFLKDAIDAFDKKDKNDTNKTLSQYSSYISENDKKTIETLSNAMELFTKHIGDTFLLNIGLTPYVHFSNFEIALGIDVGASVKIDEGPTVDTTLGGRGILPVGFAMEFLDGKLRVGTALKFVYQYLIDAHINTEEIDTLKREELEDRFLSKGSGFGADVGVLVSQPNSKFKPTLGISLANIGSPQNMEESFNTGISLQLYKDDVFTLIAASDVHSINQNISFSKKFGVGLELGIYSFLKLQTGFYKNALTAGINLDVFLLNLRFATYADQIGKSSTSKARVYMLEVKLLI